MSFNFKSAGAVARGAAALAVAVAALSPMAAHATDVAYDSLSGALAHPVADAGGNFLSYNYYYQCFASCTDPYDSSIVSDPVTGIGDYITLAPGTGRALTGFSFGVVQASGTAALDFSITLSIYDTPASSVASQTSGNIHLTAAPASTTATGRASIVQLDLTTGGQPAFNLPDTFYYSIILSTPQPAPAGFGIWLWDYYQDGTPGQIPVGTDIGNTGSVAGNDLVTTVWGSTPASPACVTCLPHVVPTITTSLDNNEGALMNGYTPAVTFYTATPVPEPTTYAMLIAGLLFVGMRARKGLSARG